MWWKWLVGFVVGIGLIVAGLFFFLREPETSPIKVGILYAATGDQSEDDKFLIRTTLFAIEEINQAGGLLGREIQPVLYDTQSDHKREEQGALELIVKEKVVALFGGNGPGSLDLLSALVTRYRNLLFYPVDYARTTTWQNCCFTGATPNQRIIPGVSWAFLNLGKRGLIVGDQGPYSLYIQDKIPTIASIFGGEIVSNVTITDSYDALIEKIKELRPDFILNTLYGSKYTSFFDSIVNLGIPTVSFDERTMTTPAAVGHFISASYFESLDNPINEDMLARYRAKYGEAIFTDHMLSAYISVHLWAKAVLYAQRTAPEKVLRAVKGESFLSPEGMTYVETRNNYLWKTARIGRWRGDQNIDVVWSSEKPVRPYPYLFVEGL